MDHPGIQDQIHQANRLLDECFSDSDIRSRHEDRFAAWNERMDDFLPVVGLILALALYQSEHQGTGEASPEYISDQIEQLLDPRNRPEALFAGLPATLNSDVHRRIQALRLASAGVSPTTGLRWLRLLQTAREVARHHR
jgi:hypothetical protein